MRPKVLFVSKPIAPPFQDGSKCLVRDVACALTRFEPHVMSTVGYAGLPAQLRAHAVYTQERPFAPSLGANARAAAWLAVRARADLWHYVFAPNARTSAVGRWLKRLRRVPVLQTVASPPRDFEPSWFFGDIVVAQSRWTESRIRDAFEAAGLRAPETAVVPPPVTELEAPDRTRCDAVRAALDVPMDAKVFLYPGDLETGMGAEIVARCVDALVARIPGAVVVFAYRAKTPRAAAIASEFERRLAGRPVRISGSVKDFVALLATSEAVLFPVDDLYGKVDAPITLLEAMRFGVPVIALDAGPLGEVEGAIRIRGDLEARLVDECARLVGQPGRVEEVTRAAAEWVMQRHDHRVIAREYETLYERLIAAPQRARDG